jgi:hypothetical protein
MNTNKFIMTNNQLDDGSFVIDFDEENDNGICNTGGYLHVRNEDGEITITLFNKDGDVMTEQTHKHGDLL